MVDRAVQVGVLNWFARLWEIDEEEYYGCALQSLSLHPQHIQPELQLGAARRVTGHRWRGLDRSCLHHKPC